MASEHYVGEAADIPDGERRLVRVNGQVIGVFNVHGRFYALPSVCFHQRGPLCEGKVTGTLTASEATNWEPEWVQEGEILRCPWHSLEFDLTTGACLAYPRRRIRTYAVKVEAGKVVLKA